jgi:LPS export ABC transporter protein LptC
MKGKFFLFFSVILALGILIIQSYEDDSVSIRPLYRESTMRGVHITHKESGRVSWELNARDAVFSGSKDEIAINALEVRIHNEPEVNLLGGSGTYNVEMEELTINSPVMISIKDAVFTTDSLTWYSRSGHIKTDDRVEFRGNKFHIEGRGLTARIKDKKLIIHKDVKGIFDL